jgi:hypothetical protein
MSAEESYPLSSNGVCASPVYHMHTGTQAHTHIQRYTRASTSASTRMQVKLEARRRRSVRAEGARALLKASEANRCDLDAW